MYLQLIPEDGFPVHYIASAIDQDIPNTQGPNHKLLLQHFEISKWSFLFCFVPKTVYGPKIFELFANFFEFFALAEIFRRPKFVQNLADSAAIRLIQKSSKSKPSSPFFGRLKFRGKFVPCELLQNFLCGYKIEVAISFSSVRW